MTRFWRDSYLRTNAYGTTSWVQGHWVERDDWYRSGRSDYRQHFLQLFSNLSVTAASASKYVVPNARCPVCGRLVFFYQNAFGSKVYFDELGPPWQKHPCTATSAEPVRSDATGLLEVIEPTVRSLAEIRQVSTAIGIAGWIIAHSTKRRPDTAVRLVGKFKASDAWLLVLQSCDSNNDSQRWFCECARVPSVFDSDHILWLNRRKKTLVAFDVEALEPKSLSYSPIKSAKAFVDALVRHKMS
jgi:hypothetical protein